MSNFENENCIIEEEEYDVLQDLINSDLTRELVSGWVEDLLRYTSKSNLADLTAEELLEEIADVEGEISNETILIGISEFAEMNIRHYEVYLAVLKEVLNNKGEQQ